jgi:hypothetical protein
MDEDSVRTEVDRFIMDEVESVPHLEALLLLWNSRPQGWSLEKMAKALYASGESVGAILADLERRGFVSVVENDCFQYCPSERDALIGEVDRAYRREVVRISTMIHAKPSASLREFARAFRLKKD